MLRIRLDASSSAMKRVDDGVVDGRRGDPAQARPPGEAREAVAHARVRDRLQQPGPVASEFDAGGPQHRPQPGGIEGGGEVAAQVCPGVRVIAATHGVNVNTVQRIAHAR
jgi:hypothetical protein